MGGGTAVKALNIMLVKELTNGLSNSKAFLHSPARLPILTTVIEVSVFESSTCCNV